MTNSDTFDPIPTESEVDQDPAVVELEQRIASGDQTVTAEDLAEERTRAAGRVRFGRLRGVFRDREERKAAEAEEVRQAEAADKRAREELAPYAPAELAAKYDAAVAAVKALGEALDSRNAVLRRLCRLPHAERPRGASTDRHGPFGDVVVLDGVAHRREDASSVVRRAIEGAGVSTKTFSMVDRTQFAITTTDPTIIAEGREAC
jgi:hypothetical protein